MASAIRDTFPLALGIALNPIAIVCSILIANGVNPRRNGIALILGWIAGLAVVVSLPALLIQEQFGFLANAQRSLDELFSLFEAALGLVLLIAAAVSLLRGPLPGDEPTNPRWAGLLKSGGAGRKFALGVFLSIVNLRNLVLLAAAASLIGKAQLGAYGVALVAAVFIAITTLGILIPLLVHLFGGDASEPTLQAWADWLTRKMGAITGVIMALLGALLLTQGVLGAF